MHYFYNSKYKGEQPKRNTDSGSTLRKEKTSLKGHPCFKEKNILVLKEKTSLNKKKILFI